MDLIIKNILYNLCSILLVTYLIRVMYKKVFGEVASEYIRNQISIIEVGCIANTIMLNVYYFFCIGEAPLINKEWQSLFLIFLCFLAGIFIEKAYQSFFRSKNSKYTPTTEEYLVLIIISFFAVALMMVADGRMPIIDVFVLILGRLIWIDTKSWKTLKESVKVKHERIKESCMLLLMSVLTVSGTMYIFELEPIWKVFIALICGFIIWKFYGDFRIKQMNK